MSSIYSSLDNIYARSDLAKKLSFIQQYYPQYGSTDAASINMMYNKAVDLQKVYGISPRSGSKIGAELEKTLKTAQAGNVPQQVQQPIQKTQPTTGTSTGSSSSTVKSKNKAVTSGTSTNQITPDSQNVEYAPTGQVDTSAFMNYNGTNSPIVQNPNYNSSDAFKFDWQLPNQTIPVQQTPNEKIWEKESVFGDNKVGSGNNVNITNSLTNSGAVADSGSNAIQKAIDLPNTLSNKWGNTSYGDAWTQGNGVLGGISNMWDKFTSPNGSMANPAPSSAENFLKSLGGVGTLAGGVADLMYKSKLANLMQRQVDQQQALQDVTLKSKNDWTNNYGKSF